MSKTPVRIVPQPRFPVAAHIEVDSSWRDGDLVWVGMFLSALSALLVLGVIGWLVT